MRGEPWLADNYYLGGRRSRIAINVDLPIAAPELVDLVAHEAYPGHHTEHAWKEHLLVDAGIVEESLVLVPTPQSMVSEGIAETAWELLEAETRDDVAAVLAAAGVDFDVRRAAAVEEARTPLRFVGLNAALMLHEDGASEEEAVAYTERWAARTRSTPSRPCASCSTRSGARTWRPIPWAATSAGGTSRGARSGSARC